MKGKISCAVYLTQLYIGFLAEREGKREVGEGEEVYHCAFFLYKHFGLI